MVFVVIWKKESMFRAFLGSELKKLRKSEGFLQFRCCYKKACIAQELTTSTTYLHSSYITYSSTVWADTELQRNRFNKIGGRQLALGVAVGVESAQIFWMHEYENHNQSGVLRLRAV